MNHRMSGDTTGAKAVLGPNWMISYVIIQFGTKTAFVRDTATFTSYWNELSRLKGKMVGKFSFYL